MSDDTAAPPSPRDDRALIRACRAGDGAAWAQLLERYERLVYSIPLNYGLSRDDAADIAQLTFTILLTALEELDDDVQLGGWLATVARRHTWRLMRRRRRTASLDQVSLDTNDGRGAISQTELLLWLDAGLARLNARCRELLMALYLDPTQPTYAEIARRLDMPVGSIGPTRGRCLARLLELLEDAPPGEGDGDGSGP